MQGSSGAADPVAGAYYEFMLARQLEDRGDIDGAIAALRRAMALHPASADLPAELSALYARQSRVRESIEAAIEYVNARPRPLSLYHFDHDRARTRRVLDGTVAGVAMMSLAVWAGGERLAVGICTSLVSPPPNRDRAPSTGEGA